MTDDDALEYGKQLERERIIKLLEKEVDIIREFDYAIRLIKGEQK